VCHVTVQNPNFYRLLLRIDQDLAEQARAQRCRCGGVLHSARYPRKPRGLPREASSDLDFRYSFCCAVCRHRTTPFSVRFFGRRVYVAAIMVAVSAARASAGTAAAMRQLDRLGVPHRTIARWRHWWITEFVTTPLWELGCAAFLPPVEPGQIPASLLERFAATFHPGALVRLLHWLTPLTSRSAASNLREGR
jgi:hypothetical protein